MTEDDDGDWREEFECEECRAWTGTAPIPIAYVQRRIRAELPQLTGFRVLHACHLRTDGEGNRHHIPTTVLEWEGHRYQWIPRLPPGYRG